MPSRPQDPERFQTWANDISARLRALERRILRGEEGPQPLQTYSDGELLGDTLHLDFGSGLNAVLTDTGYVEVTGSGLAAYTWQSATTLAVGTGQRFYAERDGRIGFCRAERSEGDGTTTATLDVLLNGVSIYPTSTKPTVAASTFLGAEAIPDTRDFSKGDYFEVEIEATGGGTGPLRVTILVLD